MTETYDAAPAIPGARTAARPALNRRARPNADVLAFGILLIVVIGFLAANFVTYYNLYRLDILTFYMPWYEHMGERLRDLDLPGWLPYIMSGAPFAGDPQSGWGYLPAMVIFTIAPSTSGYITFITFHVVLAAAGSYLYARIIGINPVGALATGFAFTLGNFMERTACCTIHMQVAVWIPAILLLYELSRRAQTLRSRIGGLVLAGIAVSQMVAGWVGQGAYYGALAIGIYILYRTFFPRSEEVGITDRLKTLAVTVVVLGIVGGSTAAPALIPRLDTVSRSNLSDLYQSDEEGEDTGWRPEEIPHLVFSDGPRTNRSYLGAATVTAAVVGGIICWRRRNALFFALYGVGVFSLIVRNSPVEDVFNLLPRFESLHIHSPDRIYVVLFIAPAILAGWLVHTLWDPSWRGRSHLRTVALAVSVATVLAVVAVLVVKDDRGYWMPTDRLLETGLIIGGVGIVSLIDRLPIRRLLAITIVLMLVIDPTGQLVRLRLEGTRLRDVREQIFMGTIEPNGAARWLLARSAEGEIFRFAGYDQMRLMNQGELRTYHVSYSDPGTQAILVNNRGVEFGLDDAQGYNPVQIDRYVEFFDAINGTGQSYHAANVLASGLNSPLLNQLNVRYFVIPAEIPPGRPDLLKLSQIYPTVYADEQSRIVENPNTLPRAWIVHEAEQEETGEDILSLFLLGPIFADPRELVLMEDEAPELDEPDDPAAESVAITESHPDEIHLDVSVSATGMVVLSEIWDPGWSATVDGEAVEVHRVNHTLRGIVVEPGQHEIVLRYKATVVKGSLLFYIVPVAALLALPLLDRRRRTATVAAGHRGGE